MDAKQIIDKLGGTAKVARFCGVHPNAVTNWKRRGIPARVVLKYPQLFLSAYMAEPETKPQPA